MKVRNLARELGQSTKELIGFLLEVDISVNSGATKLDADTIEVVKSLFADKMSGRASNDAADEEVVITQSRLTVGELAKFLDVKLAVLMSAILKKGLTLNLNSEIDRETAIEIALSCDRKAVAPVETESNTGGLKDTLDQLELDSLDTDSNNHVNRPPVIVIMGHVDHGKTQLLDTIRKSNVVEGESGGITQHIGAYQVFYKGQALTFLDTPGHEAFTALRARGAQVTDIAILVVAADEGVKPQTIEAINHAKAASIPIIVAINKIDKPGADIEAIKQALSTHDILSEDWGGKVSMMPVSAKNKVGIDELLEMILLHAEVLELQADTKSFAKGVVIEAKLSKQRGALATILIKSGTLKKGAFFACGEQFAKVRALSDDQGDAVIGAGPSMPVEVLGFPKVPIPGEILEVFASEKEAKGKAQIYKDIEGKVSVKHLKTVSLSTLSSQIGEGLVKKLNLIIKADAHGSLEAIIASIEKLPTDEVSIQVIHAGVGPITENDVMLSKASSAVLIAFSLPISAEIMSLADKEEVTIKTYAILYEIIDMIKRVITGMFTMTYEEVPLGTAEVREVYRFSKIGAIAGCYVLEGQIKRKAKARVMRDKKVVFEGEIESLKRFKEDVKDVQTGYECGIVLDGFNDVKENDHIMAFVQQETPRSL